MSKIDLDAFGKEIYRDEERPRPVSGSVGLPIPATKKRPRKPRASRSTKLSVGPDSSSTREQATNENNAVLAANVGDQPTSEDTLGFVPYVEAIASFLTNEVTKPPLTLSIEGEWGSGKSSFMLQLENELRGSGGSVVRFNAWRHDKDDAMWAAFALEFARKLSRELPSWRRWAAHLKLFLRRFNWERGWTDMARLIFMLTALTVILLLPVLARDKIVSFVTPATPATQTVDSKQVSNKTGLDSALRKIIGGSGLLAYLALLLGISLKAKSVIGNPLSINLKQHLDTPDYKSRVAFIEQFHEDFARVVDVYGGKQKVYVFIDDLDRCEVPKAADLMQALNLMISDSSQLIFIMGMDREKVAAGLAVKYEKLLPYLASPPKTSAKGAPASFDPVAGLEYGYGFIEKFIQLPFQVPQASEDQVRNFLTNIGQSTTAPSLRNESIRVRGATIGKRAEVAVTENSEMVSEILQIVAPAFDYNPRRLKQFINAFRLKTFIASRTGLFEEPMSPNRYDRLTTQKLGKFVAISLRWPLLLADLDHDHALLAKLQELVVSEIPPYQVENALKDEMTSAINLSSGESVEVTNAIARWYLREGLRQLLRAKLFTEDGKKADPNAEKTYGLARLDVNKLLQVSPVTKPLVEETVRSSSHAQPAIDVSATYPKVYGLK